MIDGDVDNEFRAASFDCGVDGWAPVAELFDVCVGVATLLSLVLGDGVDGAVLECATESVTGC